MSRAVATPPIPPPSIACWPRPSLVERWASAWLDVVRYADSMGLGQDGRRTIWPYRDWVIDAFNADMPFDEFTIKQLAGDLLPEPTISDLVATAGHRLTQTNEEGGTDDEQFRIEAVIDRVTTTWQAWQGLTFGCVQCHSHPYDPIRHEEFYEFLAFFNNTVDTDLSSDEPRLNVPQNAADWGRARELDDEIQALRNTDWRAGDALLQDESRWQPLTGLSASSSNDTRVVVDSHEDGDEYHTRGTVSKDTTFTLQAPLPAGMQRLTAVRFTGLPLHPETALADSEWGFVISHIRAELIVPDSDAALPIEIARVVADEPEPLLDPQLSLNEQSQYGFGAYSRIHHGRSAAFVLAEGVDVPEGATLRVSISQKVFELGAFPLVARRGRLAVSGDDEWSQWLRSPELLAVRERLAELNRQRDEIRSISTPIMRERPAAMARPTHVFERGNFLTKGDSVSPATPGIFPPLHSTGGATRLDMARWIASAENPLTARVAVNRFWSQMFGVGLVETQEDFGTSGESPSHPALLDDLAVRFMSDMRWSVKSLLREIALSATYRQTSATTPQRQEVDPRNRLLSRGPRQRLSAEMVRDQALAVAGLLSLKPHGAPTHPPIPEGVWMPFQGSDKWQTPEPGDPERYRRSVYTYTKRTIPYPMFASFDAPSREFCAPRRLPSNTPLQALMTLNDATFAEASLGLARRMLDAGDNLDDQLRFGFLTVTCRDIRPEELAELKRLYDTTLEQLRESSASSGASSDVVARDDSLAALSNVANVLLNLDEVMCR